MADGNTDRRWSDIIKDWTMVNQFGEVQSDEDEESKRERSEEDETGLYHSLPQHTELHRPAIPCEEFPLETLASSDEAAASAVDVGHEIVAGGSAREEDASTEMTAEHESEHIERDMTGDASVDILQPGSDDMETSSSGSSIELLDVSDEGLSHSQADDNETSGQGLNDSDKEDGRDMVPGSDGEEFITSSHTVTSSAEVRSESLTAEGGEDGSVAATDEQEVDSCRAAVSMMPSQTTEQSFDNDNGDDVDKGPDTEAGASEMLQNTATSADRTAGSESYHSTHIAAPSCADEDELLNDVEEFNRHHDETAAAAAAAAAQLEVESDESIGTEADMSIVSSVNSCDDTDMLLDAQLPDGLEEPAENIDDRCESDISGIVTDDSDLSSMSSGADIALETGNVVYRHQPNPVFNTLLTCCTVLMLCFAVGIGVGHYFGSSTMSSLCEQQLHRLRSLQDEQYLCLNQLEQFEDKFQTMSDTEHKMSAVTAVWVRKYEELVKERAHLEQVLSVSQQANDKTVEMAADYHKQLNDSHAAVQYLIGEVDRLSRELTTANESRYLSDLAAADWKSKYETAHVELEELAQELVLTRAEADETQQTLDLAQQDVARLTRDKMSSDTEAESLRDEVAALKNDVNQQKLDRSELESIILNQRYSEHPGNVITPSAHKHEPDDSKEVYHHGKEEVSTSWVTPNTSVDPVLDLSMEFVRLQNLVGKVAMELYGGGLAVDDQLNVSSDVVFVTMLKYLMLSGKQSTQMDLPGQLATYGKALRSVADCIEVLDNFTLNRQLVKTLMSPWNRVPSYVLLEESSLSSQVIEAFELCQQKFAGISNSKGDMGDDQPPVMDDVFRHYMNRTLKTVSELSHIVQKTLDRVKTLPEELFAENKTAKKISHKLTEAVGKLNSKVQSGWKRVTSKFQDVRKKWFGYSNSKKMQKQKKKDEHEKRDEQKKHTKKKGNGDKFPDKPFTESDKKVEDRKRSYKQTKSAPTGNKNREHGPQKQSDSFLDLSQLDDFFEGNRRAWRQHNSHRLRKIGGRIERLNDEMFLSMDDDDVEDIYEDLKDVKDDVEKRDKSDDLRTWMSCQLRWWKTRIHRKHRAEDLVKGCGRQLMHWQLRVLCRQQNADKLASTLPFYHICETVMPSVKPKPTHQPTYDQIVNKLLSSPVHGDFEMTEDLSDMLLMNISCADGEWYFRRVQDREDRRQMSPQWYFDRVEDRHFSRGDANWYVRAMRHNAVIADRSHQRPSDHGDVKGHTGPK